MAAAQTISPLTTIFRELPFFSLINAGLGKSLFFPNELYSLKPPSQIKIIAKIIIATQKNLIIGFIPDDEPFLSSFVNNI